MTALGTESLTTTAVGRPEIPAFLELEVTQFCRLT